MDWHNLEAGKKAAEEQAPDPVHHTPEAPIISEEEAQLIEDTEGSGPETPVKGEQPNDRRRHASDSADIPEDEFRVRPKRGE